MFNKKITIILLFIANSIFFNIVTAKEHIMSSLPTPEQEVIDISTKKCSKSCLNKLFEEGKVFSFISSFKETNDKNLLDKYNDIGYTLDLTIKQNLTDLQKGLRVALLIPQKNIGRYSSTSADAILSYLIAYNSDFEFKVFDSKTEDINNLKNTYEQIQKGEYDLTIAILTPNGLSNLLQNVNISLPMFIPTINQKQATQFSPNKNIFFGGIDYEKQIDMIISLANTKKYPLISLNDDGIVGKMIGSILSNRANVIKQENIDTKKSTNFTQTLAKIKSNIRNSMVVLNTSIIKSGLIVPQIGNANAMPNAFLSTQINYNPSLLSLMPQEDSKKLFIVSAISPIHPNLLVFNDILSADFQYDWVNYATALSLDIFISKNNKKSVRFFSESLQGNQIIYNDRFYGVKDSHFVPVKLK